MSPGHLITLSCLIIAVEESENPSASQLYALKSQFAYEQEMLA